MSKDNFYSRAEVVDYLEDASDNLEKAQKEALIKAGKHVQNAVKNKHGKRGEGRAKGSNPTPLLKSGKLRDSVALGFSGGTAIINSDMEWLAKIHEYGITYKMSNKQRKYLFGVVFKDAGHVPNKASGSKSGYITIPARPIWRVVLDEEAGAVASIVDGILEGVFD